MHTKLYDNNKIHSLSVSLSNLRPSFSWQMPLGCHCGRQPARQPASSPKCTIECHGSVSGESKCVCHKFTQTQILVVVLPQAQLNIFKFLFQNCFLFGSRSPVKAHVPHLDLKIPWSTYFRGSNLRLPCYLWLLQDRHHYYHYHHHYHHLFCFNMENHL